MKIKLSDVILPKRYREDYGDIVGLAASISLNILYNGIILTQDYNLNQGGRRLEALKMIHEVHQGNIPDCDDMSLIEAIQGCLDPDLIEGNIIEGKHYKLCTFDDRHHELCMEYEENKQRKDFDWKEEAILIKAIHEEQQIKYGRSNRSGRGWSTKDTAKLVGMSASKIQQEIKIADALESGNAEVSKSDNRAEAYKNTLLTAQRAIEKEYLRRKKLELENLEISGKLFQMDAIECVESLERGDFDHVITDPPYAISLDSLTKKVGESSEYIEMTVDEYYPYMEKFSKAVFDKLRVGYFVCFCGVEHFERLNKVIQDTGFTTCKYPLIWYKKGSGAANNFPDRHLTSICEFAVVAYKGLPELTYKARNNVFESPTETNLLERFHITQKPVNLLRDIIETFTKEGQVVADFFGGSFSCCKAAIASNRGYIGNDKSDYFDKASIQVKEYEIAYQKSQLKVPVEEDD